MKALIICSLHALCDVARFERDACNRACAMHGIPAILTPQDHARALEGATMLDLLSHLPGTEGARKAFVTTYLGILNDDIWGASLQVRERVCTALLDPKKYGRKAGIVSDYPMLTTNLVKSSALLNNANQIGTVTVPTDVLARQNVKAGLLASATSLGVMHKDVEVLVARRRDFDAAQSIGMHPRYIEEFQPDVQERGKPRRATMRAPKGNIRHNLSIPIQVEMPA